MQGQVVTSSTTPYLKAVAASSTSPLPTEVQENMTFNRIQNIERWIYEIRDTLERNLTTVLMPSLPEPTDATPERDQRTYLSRSLTDIELALEKVRSVVNRITL